MFEIYDKQEITEIQSRAACAIKEKIDLYTHSNNVTEDYLINNASRNEKGHADQNNGTSAGNRKHATKLTKINTLPILSIVVLLYAAC